MNCSLIRPDLPALLYGDLGPQVSSRLQEHLASCSACREEYQALHQTRGLLDTIPAPNAQVDFARLYREAAKQQQRRLRNWRRATLTIGTAAAAILLLTIGLNVDVRMDDQQLVIRWGSPPALVEHAPAPPENAVTTTQVVQGETPKVAELEAEMRALGELVQLLAKDIDSRDDRQLRDLAVLRAGLVELQRKTSEQWTVAQHDIAGIYELQISQNKKGLTP